MRAGAALCLSILVLVPTVAAQSAQNPDERYMVVGRVLDGEGFPATRLSVRVELVGTPEYVAPQALPTNCEGDFVVVFPVAGLGDAQVRVTIGSNSTVHPIDTLARRTYVKVTTEGVFAPPECADSREQFPDRHVVTGRLVEPDGTPIAGATVNVTVHFAIGDEQGRTTTTNEAGDYAVLFQSGRFNQAEAPDMATITWQDRTWRAELDERFGVTVADQVIDRGSFPPIAIAAGTVVLLAAGVLVWVWMGRGD